MVFECLSLNRVSAELTGIDMKIFFPIFEIPILGRRYEAAHLFQGIVDSPVV